MSLNFRANDVEVNDYIFPRNRTDIFPENDDLYFISGGDLPINLSNISGDDYEALGLPVNTMFPIYITDPETGEIVQTINDYRDDWVKSIFSNEPCSFIINVTSKLGGTFSNLNISSNSPGLQIQVLQDSGSKISIQVSGIPSPFNGEYIDVLFRNSDNQETIRYFSTEIPRSIIEKRIVEMQITEDGKALFDSFLSTLSMKDLIQTMNRNISIGIEKNMAAIYAVKILNMNKTIQELNPQIEELNSQYNSLINIIDIFLNQKLSENSPLLNQEDINDIKNEILGFDRIKSFIPTGFGTPIDLGEEPEIPPDSDLDLSEEELSEPEEGDDIEDPNGITLSIKRRNTYNFNFTHTYIIQIGEGDEMTTEEVSQDTSFLVNQNVIWYYDTLLGVFESLSDRSTL